MQSVTWIARKLKRDSESVESTFYSDTESIGSTNSDVGSPSVQAGQRNSSKFYVSLTENSDVGYTENSNGCTQNEIRDDKINRENSGANDARKSNCSTKSSTGSISSSSPSVSGKRPALKPKPKINFKFRSTSTASTEKTPSINSNGDVTPSESVSAKVNTKSSWFAKDKKPMASTSGNISKPSSINKKNEGSIKIPADSPKTNKPHIPIKPVTKYSKKLPSLSSDIPVNASSDATETKCGEINHSGSTKSPEVSSVTDGTHASDNTTKLTNCSNSDLLKVDNKNISTKDANPDEGVLRTENNIDKKLSNSNLVSENKTVTNIINKSSKFEQSQNKFTSNTTEPKIVQKTNFNNKNVADSTSLVAGIRNTLFPTNSESINSSNNPSSSLARPIPSWKRSGEVKPLTDTVGAKSGVSSIAGSSSLTCLNVDSSNIKSSTTSKSCSNLSDEPDKIKSESIPPEKNNNSSKNAENKSENTEKADSSSGPVGKILHKGNKIIIHQEHISNNDSGTSNQIDPPSTNTGASCKAGNTNTAVGRLKQRLAPGKPVGHNRRSFTTEDTDIFRGKVPCLPPTLPKKPSPLVLRKELNDKESSEQKQKESDENFRRRLSKGRSQSLSNSDVPAALLGGHAPTPKPSPPAKPKYLKNTTNDGADSAEVSSASSLSIESIPTDDTSGAKTATSKSTLLARVSVTNDKDSVNKIKRELWKGHKAKQLDRFNSVGSYSDMSSTGKGGQLVDSMRGYSVAMKPSDIYVSIGEEGNAGGGDHAYETMDFDKDPSFPEGESNPGSPDDCDLRRKYSESIASDEEDLDDHCSFSENSSEEGEEVEGAEVAHHGHHHSKKSKKGKNSPEVEMSKERKVAEELLKTERQYVEVLHLIDQVFRVPLTNKNREERFMPDGVIPWMFSCIGSIYLFHKDFLLPQLEQCMTNWESGGGRIGQVMKKLAPGLLLYTDYVKNFDNANNLIIAYRSKSQKFSSVLDEIQSRKECGHLSLQNHMLGPIQRIPRYKLLLEKALVLVSKAADHSNEAMRKIEKFRKLLEISDMLGLGGADSIVSPTRELIREGSVIKISARDGTRIERYLFLVLRSSKCEPCCYPAFAIICGLGTTLNLRLAKFNDILLVCQSSLKIGSKQQYIVKSKLDIEGMRVMYGNNPATPNTFCIRSKQKAIEFHSSSSEENDDWQKTIWKAIAELTKKITNYKENLMADNELGTRAPAWIRDQETSMCMTCGVTFTTFRRRHHCRACGQVVCSDCSKQKFALAFDNHKENRVCYICFKKLNNEKMKSETSKLKTEAEKEISLTYKTKTPSLLRVKATDTAVISGYLMMSYDCKTWSKRFIAAHNSFALYIFKAHKDMKAKSSIPLPGYQVELIKDSLSSDQSPQYIVKIFHHQSQAKTIYFQTDDTQKINRWHVVLKAFVKAELPELEGSVSTPALTPAGITDLEHPLDNSVYEEYEPGTPLNSPSVRTPCDKPTNVTKPH